MDQPPRRFVDHQNAEHEQHRPVGLAAQDLGAAQAVRQAAPGRAIDESDDHE